MIKDYPEWVAVAAQFLAENLPKDVDRPGWNNKALTAYEIGCKTLVALGYAEPASWGAIPKEPPQTPEFVPRWDDVCVSVLRLAEQQNLLSYQPLGGGVASNRLQNRSTVVVKDAPPLLVPNIEAQFGVGPAVCSPDVLPDLQRLGLISGGLWTDQTEFVHWRSSPKNSEFNFVDDERFLKAVQNAVATVPEDVVSRISDLVFVKDQEIDELISKHVEMAEESRRRFGPKARLGSIPSRERTLSSLEFMRRNDLDWMFFRRWRIDDGWLSETGAAAALEIFHDRLAIAIRKSVMLQIYPEKPQFHN